MDALDIKLNQSFAGKVVRKDLTKQIKEGANVPVFVLEYLLGMYCATDDEATITKKVMAMYTDPNHIHVDQPGQVKGNVVFTYLDIFDVKYLLLLLLF